MKIKKIIYLTLFFILFSCPAESVMWERTYQITNNSGYDITMRAFKNYTGIGSFEDIIILNGGVYIGDLTTSSNFNYIDDGDNLQPTSSFDFIRFILVYNNERSRTHSIDFDESNSAIFSEPINRHLLRGGNYTHIGNDIYEIVLTQEDYNNATPCNGDCLD